MQLLSDFRYSRSSHNCFQVLESMESSELLLKLMTGFQELEESSMPEPLLHHATLRSWCGPTPSPKHLARPSRTARTVPSTLRLASAPARMVASRMEGDVKCQDEVAEPMVPYCP